jgi:hypothetical protein
MYRRTYHFPASKSFFRMPSLWTLGHYIFYLKLKQSKLDIDPVPSGIIRDSCYSLYRTISLRFSQRCVWSCWQPFSGRHISTSQNSRPQLGSHESLGVRNLVHQILLQCWRWLCEIRHRRTSVSQLPAAYIFSVEEAIFIRWLNINFCSSFSVVNMKWQKGETGYVGDATVGNVTEILL